MTSSSTSYLLVVRGRRHNGVKDSRVEYPINSAEFEGLKTLDEVRSRKAVASDFHVVDSAWVVMVERTARELA